MTRTPPCGPPQLDGLLEASQESNKLLLTVNVVTPMFGGGYEAREIDEVNPIRAAAIRGHLRFWWRATAGGQYSTSAELFKAEEELWGSTKEPGKVVVEIIGTRVAGKKVRLDNARVPDYVRAFLIQEKAQTEKNIRQQARRDQWDPSQLHRELRARETDIQAEKDKLYPFVLPGISFDLKIRVKDTARYLEVKKAVKAFLLFGAVGGRGRRGYGSIDSIEMEGDLQSAKLTDSALWFSSLPNPLPTGLVSLCGARVFVGKPMPSAFEAWEAGVKIFHHFRKAELPGSSRPSRGLPSHTTWPEADMLRQLLRPPVARHNPAFAGETAFPRAQLGLPLKFQSQRSHAGAFGDAELYLEVGGKEIHRLASPVIIKPLKLNDKWHPAILILNSSAVRAGDLRLTTDSGARPTVDASGAPAGLFDGRNNVPFSHSHSSVLDVLADYLEKHAHWTATEVSAL